MPSTNVQEAPNKVIVACPVSGCELRHVSGVGVLMVIRYIERADQLESGEGTTLQALLDPEQALAIGEALKRSVQALQFGKSLKKSLKKSMKLLPATSPEQPAAMLPAMPEVMPEAISA